MSKEKQIPPQGDARYRTHRSVKCYLGELMCGTVWCTWNFTESIERVVYLFPGRIEKIVYKNRYYELKKPEQMEAIVKQHIADKGSVNILGKSVSHYEKDKTFEPYHFIDITDQETYASYQKLRPKWLKSKEFKNA